MAKPAGSLFECQNGRRGKGSRKPVIKIPTTLFPASPQPAFIRSHRTRKGGIQTMVKGGNLKLDVEEMQL